MKFVIPVSSHDRHRLPDFVSIIEKFGGLENHEIVIIPQPSCIPDAHGACSRLSKITKASVIPMDHQPVPGWPKSCNAQFQFAAFEMAKERTGVAWFWMELDAIPIRAGWANSLAVEYAASGASFLGNIVPTQFVKDDGSFYTIDGDNVMLGVAVYHQSLGRTDCLIKDLGWIEEPWDIFMRGDFRRFGMANSTVICDMWNTQNYRIEGDFIVCDPAPRDGANLPKKRGGPIPKSACIVHGCKDGSLERLILGADEPKALVIPQSTETKTTSTASSVVIQGSGWGSMMDEVEIPPLEIQSTPVVMPEQYEDKKPEGLKVHVKKLLRKGSLRLGNLSKETGIPPADLKCQLEGLGFIVTNPGWIKAGK